MKRKLIRKAFVMKVHPDKHDEYRKRHNPIWKELEGMLKVHGVHNYSISLNPKTNELFGYAEIESEEKWNAIAGTDTCRRWWAYMKDIMPSNPDNSPVSDPLVEVFHLK